jgi:hypothetical protein
MDATATVSLVKVDIVTVIFVFLPPASVLDSGKLGVWIVILFYKLTKASVKNSGLRVRHSAAVLRVLLSHCVYFPSSKPMLRNGYFFFLPYCSG